MNRARWRVALSRLLDFGRVADAFRALAPGVRGVRFPQRASSMVVLASLLAGCVGGVALSPGEVRDPWNPTQRVDLSNALTDKLAFLRGIPLLGHSKERDMDLLLRMTGHRFSLKEFAVDSDSGERLFREDAQFHRHSKLLRSGGYSYKVDSRGTFRSSAWFTLAPEVVCITVEELEGLLGPPSRIISAGEIPARGLGPSYIWSVIYRYPGGAGSLYQFTTGLCVKDVLHVSDLATVRIR